MFLRTFRRFSGDISLQRRFMFLAMLGAVLVPFVPGKALAHPLGNFTINQFSELTARPDGLVIRHIVDMAEIPTLQ